MSIQDPAPSRRLIIPDQSPDNCEGNAPVVARGMVMIEKSDRSMLSERLRFGESRE